MKQLPLFIIERRGCDRKDMSMTKFTKIFTCIIALVACCAICIGYASLSGTLTIRGEATANPPVFDTVVITSVQAVSATVHAETHTRLIPTNLNTTLSGTAGQSVVYRITVHNYSETETYLYNGIRYSDMFGETMEKMTVSVSTDESGTNVLPNEAQASPSGTPVAPGEDFVFYATYTLTGDVESEQIWINYVFAPVVYSVTYMNENEVWAVDYILNNQEVYYVRTEAPELPEGDERVFYGWVNANAEAVDSYPVGNTNSYTLSAKWDNLYLIIFVDEFGNVLYEETFTDSSTALSKEGQETVDAILAQLQAAAAVDDMSVAWDDYTIAGAKADIVVRPIYTYTGNLRFTPMDRDGDGIIDYYQIDAVSKLKNPTKIPGQYKGLPVETVNKLYLNDNNFDYGAGVQTIEIGEGVQTLNRNALAYTSDLTLVKLPSTMTYIGKNAFSRNFSSDKKKLTIQFNGTVAEWKALVANSHEEWHNGLKTGSRVLCSDGYFELDRGFLELGGYNWKEHKY